MQSTKYKVTETGECLQKPAWACEIVLRHTNTTPLSALTICIWGATAMYWQITYQHFYSMFVKGLGKLFKLKCPEVIFCWMQQVDFITVYGD